VASQTDRQLNRQADRQPKTQTDKQTFVYSSTLDRLLIVRGEAQHPNRQTDRQPKTQTDRQPNRIGQWREKQTKMASEGFYPMVFEFEKNFDQDWARQWVQANWVPLCSSAGLVYLLLIYLGRAWMDSRPAFNLRSSLAAWSFGLALFSILGFLRNRPSDFLNHDQFRDL